MADSKDTVLSALADDLAKEQIEARKKTLRAAVDLQDATAKELQKFKPDLVALDGDGKVVSQNWSQPKLNERKKVAEKLKKISEAIDGYITTGDFGKVQNLDKLLKAAEKEEKPADEAA